MHTLSMPRRLTRECVARHNTVKCCWVIYDRRVYDITGYLDSHPGGRDILLRFGGTDITRTFNSVHMHVDIDDILRDSLIGHIDE